MKKNEPKKTYCKHVEAADGEEEECRDKSEFADMVRENGGTDEAFEDSERTESEFTAEDGEETVEESDWPAEFRKNEEHGLKDNEKSVKDGPESTCGFIGYGTASAERCQYYSRPEAYL